MAEFFLPDIEVPRGANRDCVDVLRRMLAEAEAGEIAGVVVAGFSRGGLMLQAEIGGEADIEALRAMVRRSNEQAERLRG